MAVNQMRALGRGGALLRGWRLASASDAQGLCLGGGALGESEEKGGRWFNTLASTTPLASGRDSPSCSGPVPGHYNLQSTRSFKNRKSFYWPNIKRKWDREAVPEVDVLDLELPEEYTRTGTFTDRYKKPEGPETEVFAVIELGSKQYKVCPNDILFIDRRGDLEVNDLIECKRVLLLGSRDETVIGRPYVPNTSVVAAVESQFMEAKKIVFKKKRRNNYRRNNGFRHQLTRLRVLKINGIEAGGTTQEVEEE